MPYIHPDTRVDLFTVDDGPCPKHAGELNYILTEILVEYINRKGLRYSTLNEVIGVLECCKLELYRRIISPYEDRKITENGDCYPRSMITGE